MEYQRPFPVNENKHNIVTRKTVDNANSAIIFGGDGINVEHTHYGTVVHATSHTNQDHLVYKDEYDSSKSYLPGDIVTVYSGTTYYENTSSIADIAIGKFLCIKPVPNTTLTSTFFVNTIIPMIENDGGIPTDELANGYRWSGNKYYPISPEPTSSTGTVSGGSYTFNINYGSFWTSVGPIYSGMYLVREVGDDYLRCCAYDGNNTGSLSNVYIAKSPNSRCITSSYTLDGTQVDYSYYDTQHRVAVNHDDSAVTQFEELYPGYKTNLTVIYGMPVNHTGVMFSGSELKYIEMHPHLWTRIFSL